MRCSHTIAGQPLRSRPAQPPPHPDGKPEACLTGPLINPKSLHSGLWQSRNSTQRFPGSQHKGYPLWTECSLPFLPPVPQIKVRTWPLTGQGPRGYYHIDAFLWFWGPAGRPVLRIIYPTSSLPQLPPSMHLV